MSVHISHLHGDFITLADTRFNDKQDYNTARPLVDVLPVVNYKKINNT